MCRSALNHRGVVLLGGILLAGLGVARAADSSCSVDKTPPGDAEVALWSGKYDEALRLFGEQLSANPASQWAMLGTVRALLGQDKIAEALAQAKKYDDAHPNQPLLLDAVGEARYRRGEVTEAALSFNHAKALDPCQGQTYYDMARYLNLSGNYATAQKLLDLAHSLSPEDQRIVRRWNWTHAVPMTRAQQRAMLQQRLESPTITDEQKQGITESLKRMDSEQRGSCTLVSPFAPVKLTLLPISDGPALKQSDIRGDGLDISFNGKHRRLVVDTGASGLILSRSIAKAAGLVPEVKFKMGGVGDKGDAGAFVAHVDDIKIGPMEFKNCMVQVLERNDTEVEGLIGTDVFQDYLVTLDTPGREMRLDPLPKRPGDEAGDHVALATTDDETGKSEAEIAKDRYIAPEMKDWTPIFRWDHDLIVPTYIGEAPVKLFILDTGAQMSSITPAAAREVSHVSGNTDAEIKGISGAVKKVMEAERVSLTFAHVKQVNSGMMTFDSRGISSGSGVEISGFIGFPMLRELVISIDYRDNLIHVVYDPKKGIHAH